MIDKKLVEETGHRQVHKPTRKETKAHIKTLVENSSVSRLRNTRRVVKYGAASFTRNIWLSIAATLVMTVTLAILMITVFASLILNATAETMREKIDITIFFKPGTDQVILEEMAETMRTDPNVRQVEIADSKAEYDNFLDENKDNSELLAALEDDGMYNLMLSTMQATMRIKVTDPNNLDTIKYIVDNNVLYQNNLDTEKEPTYNVNQAEIETINSWATIAKNGGLILGAVFLVISVLVIFNTIRMAIFSRREEIQMMRLVGADPGFIRGPFLVEAEISGVISGLLATTIIVVGFRFIEPNLTSYGIDVSQVSQYLESNTLVAIYAIMILIGIIIGTISARLAIKKYLK